MYIIPQVGPIAVGRADQKRNKQGADKTTYILKLNKPKLSERRHAFECLQIVVRRGCQTGRSAVSVPQRERERERKRKREAPTDEGQWGDTDRFRL